MIVEPLLIYRHPEQGVEALTMNEARTLQEAMNKDGRWEHVHSLDSIAILRHLIKGSPKERARFFATVDSGADRQPEYSAALMYDYNRTRSLLEDITGKNIETGELWQVAADLRDKHGSHKERNPYSAKP